MPPTELTSDMLILPKTYEGLAGEKGGLYYPRHDEADAEDIWTIGRGHVLTPNEVKLWREGKGFAKGLTLKQVDDLYERDIRVRVPEVFKLIPQATPQEYNAWISLFFNAGSDPLRLTPGRLHRYGDKKGAALAFFLYHKSGKPLKRQLGLWRRRGTEALYYLTGEIIKADSVATEVKLFRRLFQLGIVPERPKEFPKIKL